MVVVGMVVVVRTATRYLGNVGPTPSASCPGYG